MSEPLDTTPCNRPSASSTNGTLASLRGRAGGTTRAVLDCSQSDLASFSLLTVKSSGDKVSRSPDSLAKITNHEVAGGRVGAVGSVEVECGEIGSDSCAGCEAGWIEVEGDSGATGGA